jgi:hypothetical protein
VTDFKINILQDFMPLDKNLYKRASKDKAHEWTLFHMTGIYALSKE